MNNERIAKELVGYAVGIFMMGVLSKGVQRIERRKERKKQMADDKENMEWKVSEKMIKQEDGSFAVSYSISRLITSEELEQWREYSEDYRLRNQGFCVARIRPNEVKDKEKLNVHIKKAATTVGKATADIMAEGAKRRVVYEFKDASRGYAKSSKDTEIFLKNNLKNHFKR